MAYLLHRAIHQPLPVAVASMGRENLDADGKAYLGASGCDSVSCPVPAHPAGLTALHAQTAQLGTAHTGLVNLDDGTPQHDTRASAARGRAEPAGPPVG